MDGAARPADRSRRHCALMLAGSLVAALAGCSSAPRSRPGPGAPGGSVRPVAALNLTEDPIAAIARALRERLGYSRPGTGRSERGEWVPPGIPLGIYLQVRYVRPGRESAGPDARCLSRSPPGERARNRCCSTR